jgi:hypothetical protein
MAGNVTRRFRGGLERRASEISERGGLERRASEISERGGLKRRAVEKAPAADSIGAARYSPVYRSAAATSNGSLETTLEV